MDLRELGGGYAMIRFWDDGIKKRPAGWQRGVFTGAPYTLKALLRHPLPARPSRPRALQTKAVFSLLFADLRDFQIDDF